MLQLHVSQFLLALHPDGRMFVNVLQDVDGLLDLAEVDAEFGIGDQQSDFLRGPLELGYGVAHHGFSFLQPFLQTQLLDQFEGDASSVFQCHLEPHVQLLEPVFLLLFLRGDVCICLLQDGNGFVQLEFFLQNSGLHKTLQRTLLGFEVEADNHVELAVGLLQQIDTRVGPCLQERTLGVVSLLLQLAERLDGFVLVVAVDVHQRQHELCVLVAGDELRDLVQNVLTLVEALGEQRIAPLLGDEAEVADRQVDQFVHQVDVQHSLLTHVHVQLDLAQTFDVQLESLRQLLEPLGPLGIPLFVETGVDPADLHLVALLVHVFEEVQLLVHLH